MKKKILAASLLAAAAGQAHAQVTVDGMVGPGEAYQQLFVQNQPTSFGDNHPSNIPPSGDPGAVNTGVELAIPLADIGGVTGAGDILLTGFVNSGDRTFLSNQVIGGLPNIGNLGGGSGVDFSAIDGQQYITINATSIVTPPEIDGFLDTAYGDEQDGWLQNNFTGFGDAQHGMVVGGGGSEIDAVYAATDGMYLYLFVAGNLEANGNGLDLFLDTVSGGQNVLSNSNPGINGGTLNNIGGLTFEAGFEADFYLTVQGQAGPPSMLEAFYADLNSGTGFDLGEGDYGLLGGALTGGDPGAPPAMVTIDNSNTAGVIGSPSINLPSRDFAVGSEIDGLYAFVDQGLGSSRLNLLVAGNLETNSNKIVLFFDVREGGQSPLRGDNVDITFNNLNRMGEGEDPNNPGTILPGLTFDTGFEADYYMAFNTGGTPLFQFQDAAVLRTDGPIRDFNGNQLDYGAFDGGEKPMFDPIPFAGPRLDVQDGFTPTIFCNYGPRFAGVEVQANPMMPAIPPINLILSTIDNSNIAGVTATTTTSAASVDTGLEISIDLDELGWDGTSEIKVTGWVANGGLDFISNQVIGGLPAPDQLGEPRSLDFSQIAGDQFVVVPLEAPCYADCDGNNILDVFDFLCFQDAFVLGDPYADCDGNSIFDIFDFLCFQDAFVIGCP
jgi:hypothetical protein